METRPPRLIEAIIERLVPPACRESVLGDWNERYASAPEYVLRALSALPFLVASQVRRTFKPENVVGETIAIYLAFALEFFVRPASLVADQVLIPILIVICTALLALVIRDAYADPEDRSAARTIRDACIAIVAVVSVEAILSVSSLSTWKLPWSLVFSGGAASIPMLFMVRWLLRPVERNGIAAGALPLDQLRRRSEDEHRKAWQLNLMWLIAGVALIILMPNVNASRDGAIFPGLFLVTILFIGYSKSKRGFTGTEQEYASLSISQDPYRNQLERKRDGLQHWAGGGMFHWKSAGATFLFFLIGVDLFPLFFGRAVGAPLPATFISTNLGLAVLGVIVLAMFWAVVRARSLHAARAIQDELDAINKVERKRP
jgi:hypothetical protein